ncbi:MAG: biotin--[acetyl-CoA-carboxylase] ligase [Pseudomonadota bacterium]
MTAPPEIPWPSGYDRRVYDRLDSTLSEAARLASGLSGPTWIVAQEQTAARGRRGRAWSTPRGNFAGTLILERREPPQIAALRSFVTALALFEALVEVTGTPDKFALKWPNDVLMQGGKVAGILLESIGDHLAIGIGVNLAHAPDAASLEPGAVPPRTLGGTLTPEAFLDVLAAAYAPLEAQFVAQGFAPIRSAWLARAAKRGEVITARSMRDVHRGTFEDVDIDGNLILKTTQGRVKITAADVYFE